MKRLLLLLSIVLYIFTLPAAMPVSADGSTFARANVREAYFFTDKDLSTSIFTVPYTYCVEVLRDEGDWYYASYASNTGIYKELKGYCRKSDFVLVEGKPDVTFLYKTVTVTYKSGDGAGSLPVLNEISVEAAFYGNFYSGATAYSYVYAQGSFGYIKGANDDYPLNLPEEKPETPVAEAPKQSVNFGLITALVICALAALALIMLYYTSKKKNRSDG